MRARTSVGRFAVDAGDALEQVRALLGHARLDTTQIYTSIRPAQLKRAVSFDEEKRSGS